MKLIYTLVIFISSISSFAHFTTDFLVETDIDAKKSPKEVRLIASRCHLLLDNSYKCIGANDKVNKHLIALGYEINQKSENLLFIKFYFGSRDTDLVELDGNYVDPQRLLFSYAYYGNSNGQFFKIVDDVRIKPRTLGPVVEALMKAQQSL